MFRSISVSALMIGACVMVSAAAEGAAATKFTLKSPDVANGKTIAAEQVLNGLGCTGGNLSPAFTWSNAPAGTKSFALTLYDPDAPTGSGWWHWVAIDIPASTHELPKGWGKSGQADLAGGAHQTRTDFGTPGYGGPCPPAGDKPHRYVFTLYALDIDKIAVPADASGAMVGFNFVGHTLAKTKLTARYGR